MRAEPGVGVGRRRGARGGLIEIVVATMLGLLLLAGALTLFVQGKNFSRASEALPRSEDALRAGFDPIERDLRMAGFWGLTNRTEFVAGVAAPSAAASAIDAQVGNNCGVNWTADLGHSVDARGPGRYDLACPAEHPAPWSEVLIVRRANVASSTPLAGTIQLQTTHQAGALFVDGGVPQALRAAAGSETHDLIVNAYYVGELAPGPDGRRQWALRRKSLSRDASGRPVVADQIIAPGVVNLRIVFGLDTNDDDNADVYVRPGAAELARGRVVSVKVALSAAPDGAQSGAPIVPLNGSALEGGAAGIPRAVVVERIVALRNAHVR